MTMMATPQFIRMSDSSTSALLEEEEEDYFLPDDDDDDESLQHHDADYGAVAAVDETLPHVPSSSMTMNSSTSSSRSMPALDTIAEQQPPLSSSTVVSHSDAAAAILEEFFFGGQSELLSLFRNGLPDDKESVRPSKQQQQPSEAGSEHGSPRSTIIPPGCSCSSAHIFSANNNSTTATTKLGERRQASMPAMSSLSSSSGSLKQPKRPSLKRRNSSVMVGVSTCDSTSSSSTSSSNTSSTSAEKNSIHDNLPVSLTNSKRNVSFTDISVREYDVELSDHPSCSYGPPIQLGWDYEEKEPTTVEDYEVTRSPHRRQNVHDLVLSYNARKHRLKHCSKQKYDKRDIAAVEKEIDKVKRERMMTEFFLPAMALDETIEQVCGYVKQVFQRPAAPAPAAVSHRGHCKIHS